MGMAFKVLEQGPMDEMSWFFVCWYKFGKAKSCFDNIHWSYQNLLFWAGIVWYRLSANQIFRCFKLKKFKSYMRYQVEFFASIEATKNIILFWVITENTLGQSICRIFYFWLVWLVNLNSEGPLLHYTYSI